MKTKNLSQLPVLFCLFLMTAVWGFAAELPVTLFQEDFETYSSGSFPVGWQLVYNGAGNGYQYVDGSQAEHGSQSLHLQGANCWSAIAYHAVTLPRQFQMSGYLKVTGIAAPGCGNTMGVLAFFNPNVGDWGTYYAGIHLRSDGKIYSLDNSVAWPIQIDQWNKIEVFVDLDRGVSFARYNGGELVGPIGIPTSGEPTGVGLRAGHGSQVIWYDSVTVSAWSPPQVITNQPVRLKMKVNFAPDKLDTASIKALVDMPVGLSLSNLPVQLSIGSVRVPFTLNGKGGGTNGLNKLTVKLKGKPVMSNQLYQVTGKFKGDWNTEWADDGLINATTNMTITVPALLLIDGNPVELFYTEKALLYKATQGKSGQAK
jgi:hypothetical protein